MTIFKRGILLSGVVLSAVVFSACVPGMQEDTQDAATTSPAPVVMDAGAETTGETMPAEANIVETAQEAGLFNTLLAAAEAAGLAETLATTPDITVFAPTDAAFEKLPAGTVEGLLEDPEALAEILQYHVVSGVVTAEQVVTLDSATTLQGDMVNISVEDGTVMINDATVVTPDVMASNGVIHVIDTVLLPQ